MNDDLKIAIQAALEAGNEIIKIYNSNDYTIELKADNSPLTWADRAAHHSIVEHLNKTNYPVLSEEGHHPGFKERAQWHKFWLVDPLDGTKEFIKRNGQFTVNIALIDRQTPCLGVVYLPVTKTLYFADNTGAFKSANVDILEDVQSKAIPLPLNKTHEEFIIAGSGSHMNTETEEYIQQLDKKGKTLKIVTKGSSLKFCMLAEGEVDCYPRLGPTMEWDTAAGHAIVLFAGKTVHQYPSDTPLIYNKENLLNPWFVAR